MTPGTSKSPGTPAASSPVDDTAGNSGRIGKMRPPRQRIAVSPRTRLIEQLDMSIGAVLTIAQSPAGFGKTVLLGQWFEVLRTRPDVLVGWLSLDEDDREVTHFLANVASTLAAAGVCVSPEVTAQAQSFSDVAHRRDGLCAAIDSTPQTVVLILDDYHRVASPDVDAVIDQMVRTISSGFQLVISTRDPTPLRIADLEVKGLVGWIGAADLALSLDDTAAIFGGQISPKTIATLHMRTEGWAVALQLAKLWLDRDQGRQGEVAAFTGRTDAIARYLLEQVLQDLDPMLHEFLVETSILETFDVAIADAVRGRGDSQQALQRLARFDALLVPLDAGRRWFRYHQLFAEFLGEYLEVQMPGRAVELNRRAADVFAAAGDIQRAVKHACRAGDLSRAIDVIQRAGGWELVLHRGIGFARGLFALFTDPQIEQEPVLLRMRGYLHMKYGALDEARRCIDKAASLTSDAAARRDGMIIDALLRTYCDDVQDDKWLAKLEDDVAALPADDDIGRGTLRAALAVSALGRGAFDRAEHESRAGIAGMVAAGSVLGEAYCRFHLAQSLFYRGRIDEAEAGLRAVLVAVEERHGGDRALKAIGNGLLANILNCRGEFDEARRRLEEALPAIEAHDSWVDVLGAAYCAGIALARQSGEFAAAIGLLERIDTVARARSLPQLMAMARAWRIETMLAIGNVEAAESVAALVVPHPGWRAETATGIALAQLHLRASRSADALRLLRAGRTAAALQRRLLDVARIDTLLAVAFRTRGEQQNMLRGAEDALNNAAAQAAPGVLLGLVLDIEPMLNAVLRAGVDADLSDTARTLARRLRSKLSATTAPATSAFSARELAVLSELCVGRSNKEIGRRLDLTENTIKFHLKNIYDKLGAHTRSGAVTLALQRRLIRID